MWKMETEQNNQLIKDKYIVFLYLKRIGFYILFSFLPNYLFYFADRLQDEIRQSLTQDLEFITLILNVIFIFAFIYLLYLEKRHIFNIGVKECEKIKDQMKFHISLAIGTIAIYLTITAVLAAILAKGILYTSLLVPIYLFYMLFDNILVSYLLAIVTYSLITFIILFCPYLKLKADTKKS